MPNNLVSIYQKLFFITKFFAWGQAKLKCGGIDKTPNYVIYGYILSMIKLILWLLFTHFILFGAEKKKKNIKDWKGTKSENGVFLGEAQSKNRSI